MARTRAWALNNAAQRTLLFPGAIRLLASLEDLIRRRRRLGRKDAVLPVVVVVGGNPDRSPLLGIEAWVRALGHCLAEAIDDVPAPQGSSAHSRRQQTIVLVDKAVGELSGSARGVRRVRFPHYAVATWLLYLLTRPPRAHGHSDRPNGQPDRTEQHLDDEFKAFIRDRYRLARAENAAHNVATDVPWWIRWPILAAPRVGLLLIRSVWSVPRWFRKQQIGNLPSGSFTGLARRLADRSDDGHYDDDIREMVVDAFLQDLRRAWRRSSFLGAGRRRLMYPVLILRHQPGSDTVEQFLTMLMRCRTRRVERGNGERVARWDPLLAVTAYPQGCRLPAVVERQPRNNPTNPLQAYNRWLERRDDTPANEREQPLVFYIAEQFCAPDEDDAGVRRDDFGYLDDLLSLRPRWLLPPIGPLLAALVLVTTLVVGGISSYLHCGGLTWTSTVNRQLDTDECIGVSTGDYRFFSGIAARYGTNLDPVVAKNLADIEEKIATQNDQITGDATDGPAHRTIVFLSVLTPKDPRSLGSELEGLRGLYIAQRESIHTRAPLRILLANAGDGLSKAKEAVDAIQRAKAADPSLVGVTGLGISVDATRAAVSQLAGLQLTTVGTLLSATDLATLTPEYYHQVGPTNAREASVASYYARGVTTAKVYYSGDKTDRYSSDLAEKFRDAMAATGVSVELLPYESQVGVGDGRPVEELGQDACSVPSKTGLAFYAGRSERLLEFLRGMKATCEGTYPRVLLGDDVNRFAIQTGFREFPGLQVDYMSFASSLSWPGTMCEGARDAVGFYRKYLEVFQDCAATRDGSAAMTYDAGLVIRLAIERAREDTDTPPSSDRILTKINEMVAGNGVTGATGRFELAKKYGNGRVPVDKAILVLRSQGGRPPTQILLCGEVDTAVPAPDPGCPTDP